MPKVWTKLLFLAPNAQDNLFCLKINVFQDALMDIMKRIINAFK
jgi:hypothetical protein